MREFLTTGVGICALVFTLLGIIFTSMGLALGGFLYYGGGSLAVGIGLAAIRLAALRRRAWLLETGLESCGTIVDLTQNPRVRLNGRNPWVVRYRYEAQGCEYQGLDIMMDLPAWYARGASVAVMYDPTHVRVSVLNRGKKEGAA